MGERGSGDEFRYSIGAIGDDMKVKRVKATCSTNCEFQHNSYYNDHYYK